MSNHALGAPTRPTALQEVVLYEHNRDTGDAIPDLVAINFITLDQAGTLHLKSRKDRLGTFADIDGGLTGGAAQFPLTVTPPSAGFDNNFRIDVSDYPHIQITFVAGATPPSAAGWPPTIVQKFLGDSR